MNHIVLKYWLCRLVRQRKKSLQEACVRSWNHHPPETQQTKSAFFNECEWDELKALAPNLSKKVAVDKMRGTLLTHRATEGFLVENAVLCSESLWTTNHCRRLSARGGNGLSGRIDCEIPEAALAGDFSGGTWFGHWMMDDLPLQLLAQQYATPIVHHRPSYAHEASYRELLGMPVEMRQNVLVRRLNVFVDFPMNTFKRERYERLRQRLATSIQSPSAGKGKDIYIVRGNDGSPRCLANEDRLIPSLEKRGFVILHQQQMTPQEITGAMLGCRLVVSMEGSHPTHALYTMASHGKWMIIQPADRFCTNLRALADCMGWDYGFTIAKQVKGGYHVDLDRLNRTLDTMLRAHDDSLPAVAKDR